VIILDTNVLSALTAEVSDPTVAKWLDRCPRISIWTTSVCLFEMKFGLNIMPEGKRRRALGQAIETLIEDILENRIAAFDFTAAVHAAEFAGKRKALGRPVKIRDVMIAGVASATGATLATRNIRDFEHSGLELLNPWDA
jgi:toxin FitB